MKHQQLVTYIETIFVLCDKFFEVQICKLG